MRPERRVERIVGPADAGQRIDVFVGALPDVETRAAAQRLIDEGRVTVDGTPVRKRHVLHEGQSVRVLVSEPEASRLDPEDVALTVRYEDEHLLVVDKPAGVVVHPSRGHSSGTLVHGLLHRGVAGGETMRPGIVHRLDRDTSGLLVVAKSERSHRRLQALLRDREVERRYLVLVHGAFPPALAVNREIGRDRRNRTRMSVNTDRPREARTTFRRLEQYDRHSLLEARLDTGRTHQIRVHLQSVKFPVVGDPVYGRPGATEGLDRQFLHAAQLRFPHPESGEEIHVTSPLPGDLQHLLDRLSRHPDAAR